MLGLGVIVFGFAFFYYLVIFLPQREQSRVDQQGSKLRIEQEQRDEELVREQAKELETKRQTLAKQASFDKCMVNSAKNCLEFGADACKDLSDGVIALCSKSVSDGIFRSVNECALAAGNIDISGSPDCRLPKERFDAVVELCKESRDQCYKLYK